MDTFAYRQPAWAEQLRIFEVDHPASQACKRERLQLRSIPVPSNLVFAQCDFEKTGRAGALQAASFDFRIPTFSSWLGVTQYIRRKAIETTLRLVACLPQGFAIVFEFVLPENICGDDLKESRIVAQSADEIGEPWITRLPPDEWKRWLPTLGFSKVFHLTPEMANEGYFARRKDGLSAPRLAQMLLAEVCGGATADGEGRRTANRLPCAPRLSACSPHRLRSRVQDLASSDLTDLVFRLADFLAPIYEQLSREAVLSAKARSAT